ncbi:MAG: hypothetical protein LCH84_18135 [Gemmatimonadetes bacterium]|nr:hypothetical protein [Gemmatimonadota bacterium]
MRTTTRRTDRIQHETDPLTLAGGRLRLNLSGHDIVKRFHEPVREADRLNGAMRAALSRALATVNAAGKALDELEARGKDLTPEALAEQRQAVKQQAAEAFDTHRRELQQVVTRLEELAANLTWARVTTSTLMVNPAAATTAAQMVALLPATELAYAAKQAAAKEDFAALMAIHARASDPAVASLVSPADRDAIAEAIGTLTTPAREALRAYTEAAALGVAYAENAADEVEAWPFTPSPLRMLQRANGATPYLRLALDPTAMPTDPVTLLRQANAVPSPAPQDTPPAFADEAA